MRLQRTLASAAILLALGLSGCSPSQPDAQAASTLKIAFFNDNTQLVSIDPFQVYWLEHRVVLRNVVEALTDQDPQTGQIIPWLAERWEVSEDSRQFSFHLREGVTFADGSPLDAAAVKAKATRLARKRGAGEAEETAPAAKFACVEEEEATSAADPYAEGGW